MPPEYYDHTTYPAIGAAGSSAAARAEFAAIEVGFDKLPALATKATYFVRVNAGGTALESVSDINGTGLTINNIPIGGTTRAAGAFTTLAANGAVTFTSTLAVTGVTTLGTVNATASYAPTMTTVTASFGASGAQVATLDFVNAVATSAALPGQTGDANRVMITDGVSTASWSALKTLNGATLVGAGNIQVALVLLATLTPTAAAAVDFLTTLTSGYDNCLIAGVGVGPNVTDTLKLRFANAGSVDTGTKYASAVMNTSTTTMADKIDITTANIVGGEVINFMITIANVNDAVGLKTVSVNAVLQNVATPEYVGRSSWGIYDSANTVTGGRLYWGGGNNFEAKGKIRIYGYNNT